MEEDAVLLKTSAALVQHAIPIAVLLTRLQASADDDEDVITDACIARSMALAFMTQKTTAVTHDGDEESGSGIGVEDEDEDNDDEIMLDVADLLSQIKDLEDAFHRYEPSPSDCMERHVVEYIRRRLLETNTGS